MWTACIVTAGLLVVALIYFHLNQETTPIAKPAKTVCAALLFGIAMVLIFVPGLSGRGQLDLIDDDLISLSRAGTIAGNAIAAAEPGAQVHVVRYERADGPVAKAIFLQQGAFVDGLFESEGLGQVKEQLVEVSSEAAALGNDADGNPAEWFPQASLDSVMEKAAPGSVIVLLTGLPNGMGSGGLNQENHRYVLFGPDKGDLTSALKKQHAICAILEGPISQQDEPDGRYTVLTPSGQPTVSADP